MKLTNEEALTLARWLTGSTNTALELSEIREPLAGILGSLPVGKTDKETIDLFDEAARAAGLAETEIYAMLDAAIEVDPSASSAPVEMINGRHMVYTAASALQPMAPIDWVIEDIVAQGGVAMLVGPPGCGKTYFSLVAGMAVAVGESFMELATKQGPVLIIDEESGKRRLQQRLCMIMKSFDAAAETPLYFTSLAQINLFSNSEHARELASLVTKLRIRLVVVDALVDIAAGGDENSSRDMHLVLSALRSLADQTQAAILIIHHTGKEGKYRGSTELSAALDTMLKVEREGHSNVLKLSTEKARDSEPFTAFAELSIGAERVSLKRLTKDKDTGRKRGETATHILRFLQRHGPSSVAAMVDEAAGCSPTAVRQALMVLKKEGLVIRTDNGGAGAEGQYGLKQDGHLLSEGHAKA